MLRASSPGLILFPFTTRYSLPCKFRAQYVHRSGVSKAHLKRDHRGRTREVDEPARHCVVVATSQIVDVADSAFSSLEEHLDENPLPKKSWPTGRRPTLVRPLRTAVRLEQDVITQILFGDTVVKSSLQDRKSIPAQKEEDQPDASPISLQTSQNNGIYFQDDGTGTVFDPEDPRVRTRLLRTIADTQSASEAWNAYHSLVTLAQHANYPPIPYPHLHRLARLISKNKPRTRTLFMRLLSVLSHLRRTGGRLQLWEWNALIDMAGKGWRKTRPGDFKQALDIYNDFTTQKAPGATLSDQGDFLLDNLAPQDDALEPDIITYTTLLNVAARTLHPPSICHATNLLKASGLPPNRITHLSLLRYYTRTGKISGLRTTLAQMKEQGHDIGLDGTNATIWAFARNQMMDIASTIYRVLRHNVIPEFHTGEHDIEAAKRYLRDVENLDVPDDVVPNQITYVIMIQTLAYHGDLIRALQVFMDMLSTPNLEGPPGDTMVTDSAFDLDEGTENFVYAPTFSAFRALFVGFARHGNSVTASKLGPRVPFSHDLISLRQSSVEKVWDMDNLEALFENFLDLPDTEHPSSRTIYWLMQAFARTSNNNQAKLEEVWSRLKSRFGGTWRVRLGKSEKQFK